MSSSIVLLSFAITIFIHLVTARNQSQLQDCTGSAEYCWNCSANGGNYTANSIYERNLDSLLLSIYSSVDDQSNYLFYNASLGRDPDDVNAISLCRGGLALESCQKCLNDTSHMLLERCPNRKEAILWGERCMVRYSDSSIFSVEKNEPIRILPSPNEAADAEQFKEVLKPLLDDLISKAATDVNKYAYNSAKVPNSEPIYALVQCTPDLSQKECSDCLQDSSLKIPDCCYGKNGARILKPSCNLRYESGPFYDDNGPEDNGICTQTAEFCWNCFDVSNDSGIAIFEENLKKLLSFFSSNSTRNAYGFYNSSLGEGSNRVNAMALCRGDLSPEICQSCIYNSSERLLGRCPNRREAILWDELCMVRYSNRTIFSVRQDDPRKYVPSPNEAWEPNLFMITLKPLLDNLISKAASGDSLRKYASGQSTVPGYETIYATAQCTPDLNEQQCSGCLQESTLFIPQQFGGKQGARILKPSCNLRYEVSQFFVPTADPPVSLNSSKGKSKIKRTIIVAGTVPTVIVVIMIISVCVFLKMMRKPGKKLENDNEISWAELLQFDFETIRAATDDFSDENKLGQGGFGAVYRGRLSNGHIIAVKRLSETSGQGDQEFKNEVMLVARLQHRNLVRLLGFCLDEKERLLVYEYVPNSSLDKFIFDPIKRTELDWDRRYKIIQGIVRGLLYLHEDSRFRIIHRDLKASNILLDDEMNPKISDFGMARLFVFDQTQGNTSRIVGTYGYMAPEYVLHGQFSVKSDIFSFGVLILEIVSGHKNSCIRNGEEVEDLLTYAWQNWREGTASNIIDPTLSVGSRAQIMRCIHVGLLCVQENVADRPTMNSIVLMFNSNSATLAVPSKPAFFMHSATRPEVPAASDANSGATQSDHSQNVSAQGSQNEVSVSEAYPR